MTVLANQLNLKPLLAFALSNNKITRASIINICVLVGKYQDVNPNGSVSEPGWLSFVRRKGSFSVSNQLTKGKRLYSFLTAKLSTLTPSQNTGRFIMFYVVTNIYNKKTKGPILMELFTATEKLKKFFLQLEMFDVCISSCQKKTFSVFLCLWTIPLR